VPGHPKLYRPFLASKRWSRAGGLPLELSAQREAGQGRGRGQPA